MFLVIRCCHLTWNIGKLDGTFFIIAKNCCCCDFFSFLRIFRFFSQIIVFGDFFLVEAIVGGDLVS